LELSQKIFAKFCATLDGPQTIDILVKTNIKDFFYRWPDITHWDLSGIFFLTLDGKGFINKEVR